MDLLHDFFFRWKLKVNTAKSECIVFTRRRVNLSHLFLQYGGDVIDRVDRMKLLGLHIDKKLSYTHHVEKTITRAQDVFRKLRPLLKRNSGLSSENKIVLYKVFVRSILTYGITIWNTVSMTNFRKVEVFQNKILRRVWNLRPHPVTFRQVPTRTLLEISEIESIMDFTKRLTKQMYDRMGGHPNSLIEALSEISVGLLSRHHPFYVIRDEL